MEKQYVVGIDMGGTNTTFAIVDARGSIYQRGAIKTGDYETAEAYTDALCNGVNDLVKDAGLQGSIKGIGMGAPNGNYYRGTIELAANIPWANKSVVPIAQMITDKTGLPCQLTNDANAAAVGEMTYGAAKGMKDFIVITLGTGVGSGVFCNGQLVCGHDGFAGELGHVNVRRFNGRACGCGATGCLEAYSSATGLVRTAKEMLELRSEDSILRSICDRALTSKDVFDAAEKKDFIAQEIFKYTGNILGEAFANFIAFSSPEAIILFGGLARAGSHLLEPMQKSMDENVLSIFKGKTKLLVSNLNDSEAAILGASALAWEDKSGK
ncbi:manno(fructo)kinase [Bacteroidales bacterium]|nr:manno(fructo)kinase [Bacteroidales bacterium]